MKSASILDTSSKITSAILVSILLLSSILSFTLVNAGTPPIIDTTHLTYQKDYGLLTNDTYILYPWAKTSLNIGFSKYGEMINDGTEDGTGKSLGLSYGGIDVFASSALAPYEWSNGWLMDIHYVDNGMLKNIWAYALYSDLHTADGDWRQLQHYPNGTHPSDTYGGRRTSGWCVTDPIRVVYDGPRKAIYLLRTIIHDDDPAADGIELIQLDIQLIFNKVKKYVIEIKDIKRLEESKWTGPMQVEFSQRGEWDVGTTRVCNSYAEFYNDLVTVYDKHPFYGPYPVNAENKSKNVPVYYDLAQIISTESGVDLVAWAAYWPSLISKYVTKTYGLDRNMVLTSLETHLFKHVVVSADDPLTTDLEISLPYDAIEYPRGAGVWDDTPWVFKGPNKAELESPKWTWTSPDKVTIKKTHWAKGNTFWVLYKRERLGIESQTSTPASCCEGMFATLGDQTTYGMDEEPRVPYVMGEWDFELSFNNKERSTHHFRCATVYGVTDDNDADDPDKTPLGTFMIDSEVQYQLNEVFNPWDLYDAAHKDKFRWAQKGELPSTTPYSIVLKAHKYDKYYNSRLCLVGEHDLVYTDKWTDYCKDSEKVVLYDINGTKSAKLLIPDRGKTMVGRTTGDYTFDVGNWEVDFVSTALTGYEYYKVLYSTDQDETVPECWDTGRWEWIIVGRDSRAVDSAGAAMVSIAWEEWKGKQVWLSALDMRDDVYGPTVPYVLRQFVDLYDSWYDYTYVEENYRVAFKDDWSQPPFANLKAYYDKTGDIPEIYPYAISSSNVIVVGGPYANKAAWYFNDFTDAFVFSEYEPGFYAPGCWARTSQPTVTSVSRWGTTNMEHWVADELWYNSTTIDDARGHAIVSTYKDLNGTVGFIIYGYEGEDTYYATYAFRGGLLLWLQKLQRGVTTLILEFDYESTKSPLGTKYKGIHPIGIHVMESLGTITECTGFGHNFKTPANTAAITAAETSLEGTASQYGLCYKLVDITWCAQVHPDP